MPAAAENFFEKMVPALKQYWGYDDFRPFQKEIIESLLQGKDILSVLPTGGGKSLCFQLPALLREGLTVVISPLISLMKDQVDGLKEMGIPAEVLNSSLTFREQSEVLTQTHLGQVKLLYLSPERLASDSMRERLKSLPIAQFVIDEAHCISHWGHDFRPEYRALQFLREQFSAVPIAAFTATATPDVQRDILAQLHLRRPREFIAGIDRPNLTYRVFQRSGLRRWRGEGFHHQLIQILERHRNEPGIIYCLKRDDVDELSTFLNEEGFKNLPYHAGMEDQTRKEYQAKFAREEVDIIVATIAFGMGIDRSNIRFVIHAAMPQSLEHYQQEMGRAGRDSLPAFGYLFFGASDYRTRLHFIEASKEREVPRAQLNQMYDFCLKPQCRHKRLVEYFGQNYTERNCKACDFCLDEIRLAEDALIIGQKILSCVARLKNRFGKNYVARILKGEADERALSYRHQELSTFGLMKDQTLVYIRSMIDQLVGQGFLGTEGEFATLNITPLGWELLQGRQTPRLALPLESKTKKEIERKTRERIKEDWSRINHELFERLRQKRSQLAQSKGVPAFVIFGDRTLKEMALKAPQKREEFGKLFGVGEHKLEHYSEPFLNVIQTYLNEKTNPQN